MREFIFYKNAAFRSAKIGSPKCITLIIKRLMNNSDPRSIVYGNTYHTSDMMKMAFGKSFSTIKRINPDNHIFFIKLIWKIIKGIILIKIFLRGLMKTLHFLEILLVSNPLYFKVVI
jgi:hypothetical protein